ncbi:hypothetical protein [Paenibacillus elgii]|uniref:hypothetical protein n=1 Tax=Paenibacillus elgii TaxID=189691 RepID=UPI00203EFE20|nr:hypothetical protein [Paenibacillus elgii]MCM3272328.1 hypothetical protein [Paenibacillus elgii]
MHFSNKKTCVVFNKLFVTNIEDSSGIFIGNNTAIGWSSYGKSNRGLGNLSNCTLTHVINVVYDQDVIDTSIEDISNIVLTEKENAQLCTIDFNSVNANSVNSGSAIDLGENRQLGWRSSRKNNYGTGKAYGSNNIRKIVNSIFDSDFIDTLLHTEDNNMENTGNLERNIYINQKKKTSGSDK